MRGECGAGGSCLSLRDETSSLRSDCPLCSPFATCGCSNTNELIIIIIKLSSSDILAPLQGLNSHRWPVGIPLDYADRQHLHHYRIFYWTVLIQEAERGCETPKNCKVKFAKCRTKNKCCKFYLCPKCALLPSVPPCKRSFLSLCFISYLHSGCPCPI